VTSKKKGKKEKKNVGSSILTTPASKGDPIPTIEM
jgi:hypothetical protein